MFAILIVCILFSLAMGDFPTCWNIHPHFLSLSALPPFTCRASPNLRPVIAVGCCWMELDGVHLDFMKSSSDLTSDINWSAPDFNPHRPSLRSHLEKRIDRDGYILIKHLIPKSTISAAQRRLVQELRDLRFIVADNDDVKDRLDSYNVSPEVLCGSSCESMGIQTTIDPALRASGWRLENSTLFNAAPLRNLFTSSAVMNFYHVLFNTTARPFDYKHIRPVPPNQFSGFHVDWIFMCRGSKRLHTTWIPLMDIDVHVHGAITVVADSNHDSGFARIRETYGKIDVDDKSSDIRGHAWFSLDPYEILVYGGRFVVSDFEMGDVVIFPMTTMHGSTRNVSGKKVRLSVDMRVQPANEKIDDRWVGSMDGHRLFTAQRRHDPAFYPRSMEQAKCDWGLKTCKRAS